MDDKKMKEGFERLLKENPSKAVFVIRSLTNKINELVSALENPESLIPQEDIEQESKNLPRLDEITDEYIETFIKDRVLDPRRFIDSLPSIREEVGERNTEDLLDKCVIIGKDFLRFIVRNLIALGAEWDFTYLMDEIEQEREEREKQGPDENIDPLTPLVQELIERHKTDRTS